MWKPSNGIMDVEQSTVVLMGKSSTLSLIFILLQEWRSKKPLRSKACLQKLAYFPDYVLKIIVRRNHLKL